jgi:hypothetical protein
MEDLSLIDFFYFLLFERLCKSFNGKDKNYVFLSLVVENVKRLLDFFLIFFPT